MINVLPAGEIVGYVRQSAGNDLAQETGGHADGKHYRTQRKKELRNRPVQKQISGFQPDWRKKRMSETICQI